MIHKPKKAARVRAREVARQDRVMKLAEIRQDVLVRAKGTCELCKSRDVQEVHHLFSGSGKRRLQERVDTMMGVCLSCHEDYHASEPWAFLTALRWAEVNGYTESAKEISRRLDKVDRGWRRMP